MCLKPIFINGFWAPCGQCLSCKKHRASDWTIRVLNEYEYWKGRAAFLTFTYDKYWVPQGYNLMYSDIQKMMKLLRIRTGRQLKYFVCGEYGPKTQRPHYHMILFGLDNAEVYANFTNSHIFNDKLFGTGEFYGDMENICSRLEPHEAEQRRNDVWFKGHVEIGTSINPAVCRYVAQYTVKKLKHSEYAGKRTPPFLHCSQGFGKRYALDNVVSILTKGSIAYADGKFAVPRYYFKLYDKEFPSLRVACGLTRATFYSEVVYEYAIQSINNAFENFVPVFDSPPVVCYDISDGDKLKPLLSEQQLLENRTWFKNKLNHGRYLYLTPEDFDEYNKTGKLVHFQKGEPDYFCCHADCPGMLKVPVTEEYHSFVRSLALQEELNLRAKYKNAREKV